MKKILRKIAFVLMVLFFAGIIASCELAVAVVYAPIGLIGETGHALAMYANAGKIEMPLLNLKRINKGVYTVDVDAWNYSYSEAQRNNAINLLVQSMGYESYDFKITGKPYPTKKSFRNVWSYSVTMPGSIPVVRNEKYKGKIAADTICTPVTNTTFGKSKINGIAYGDGKFVAVSEDKKMAYSSDSITWTAVKNTSYLFYDIAYGNGKFIAVGYYGGGKIVYSSDGVNWTEVKDSSFKKDSIGSIVYGNGMFVAATEYASGKLAYSSDGINWTRVKKFPFKKKYIDIAYGGGKFFVFDSHDNGNVAYSSDGVNWTAMTNPFGKKNSIENIIYGNGKFVAVGYGGIMAYSSDCVNWTLATDPIYAYGIFRFLTRAITFGDGKFFAVGSDGKMAYSSDGITWITIADSTFRIEYLDTQEHYDIAFGDGKFVVVGSDGKMAYWNGN